MNISDVRKVLLEVWDPLGIGDNPNLADEYDSCLPEIIRLLQQGSGIAELATYLERVENELEVSAPSEGRLRAAKTLVEAEDQNG